MSDAANIDAYIKSLQEDYQPRARIAAVRALERFAEAVMGQAQELAPVKTGALKASGVVEDAVVENNIATITLGFNTNYAAAVHEILTNKHLQGQAKFLEAPMNEMAPKLGGYILDELRKEFG